MQVFIEKGRNMVLTRKKLKKFMFVMLSAVLLTVMSGSVTFASSKAYSGKVTKYKDYETSYMKKANKTSSATNNAKKKPKGTFSCWIELSNGKNCSYKTSYSTTGKKYMSYHQKIDASDTCADLLYTSKNKLKLNISTVLVNFKSGSVSGTWSPDKV